MDVKRELMKAVDKSDSLAKKIAELKAKPNKSVADNQALFNYEMERLRVEAEAERLKQQMRTSQ